MRRHRLPVAEFRKEMVRCWEEKSVMVKLRLEFVLNMHEMEAFDRRLLKRKPSKPRGARKEEGGDRVIGLARKIISGDLEEIRWWRYLRVGEFEIPLHFL